MQCFFCALAKKEISRDVIFENDNVIVMLDDDWAVKGHTLVIWKNHFENLSELSKEEFAEFSEIVRRTEKVLINLLKVDKSVILKSGNIISHFHFHIYPVFKETSWRKLKDIFDKKTKYEVSKKEKELFVSNLTKKLNQ